MNVNFISADQVTLVKVEGEINTLNAAEFQAQIEKIIDANQQNITLDMAGVEYVSSAGLRALFSIAQKVAGIDCAITLKGVQGAVMEVLEFSGFDEFFEFE